MGNGFFWTTPSLSSTPGWPRISLRRVRTSSPWRRWSPPWASSRTSSSRRRSWLRTCKPPACPPSLFAGSLRPIIPNIEHTYRRYNVALFYKVQSGYSEEAESLSNHESMTVTGSSHLMNAHRIFYTHHVSCLVGGFQVSLFVQTII